jgi:hypothetical protein
MEYVDAEDVCTIGYSFRSTNTGISYSWCQHIVWQRAARRDIFLPLRWERVKINRTLIRIGDAKSKRLPTAPIRDDVRIRQLFYRKWLRRNTSVLTDRSMDQHGGRVLRLLHWSLFLKIHLLQPRNAEHEPASTLSTGHWACTHASAFVFSRVSHDGINPRPNSAGINQYS